MDAWEPGCSGGVEPRLGGGGASKGDRSATILEALAPLAVSTPAGLWLRLWSHLVLSGLRNPRTL